MTVVVERDLIELAGKCERLTEPDRELDLAILRAISGNPWRWADSRTFEPQTVITWDQYGEDAPGNPVCTLDEFTGSIDAAMTLLPKGSSFALGDLNEANFPWACVTDAEGVDYISQEDAATPVLAFLSAILRARASMKGEG